MLSLWIFRLAAEQSQSNRLFHILVTIDCRRNAAINALRNVRVLCQSLDHLNIFVSQRVGLDLVLARNVVGNNQCVEYRKTLFRIQRAIVAVRINASKFLNSGNISYNFLKHRVLFSFYSKKNSQNFWFCYCKNPKIHLTKNYNNISRLTRVAQITSQNHILRARKSASRHNVRTFLHRNSLIIVIDRLKSVEFQVPHIVDTKPVRHSAQMVHDFDKTDKCSASPLRPVAAQMVPAQNRTSYNHISKRTTAVRCRW